MTESAFEYRGFLMKYSRYPIIIFLLRSILLAECLREKRFHIFLAIMYFNFNIRLLFHLCPLLFKSKPVN